MNLKKIISSFLLIVFLFNTVGYFIAFKAIKHQAKKEIISAIESGLRPEQLIIITINKTDLTSITWEEDGREMIYKDELYDIVKSVETAESVTYYCINDSKEQLLFTELDKHINTHVTSNKQGKNSSAKKITDTLSKLYFLNEQLFFFFSSQSDNQFPKVCLLYPSLVKQTNSLPPEFI